MIRHFSKFSQTRLCSIAGGSAAGRRHFSQTVNAAITEYASQRPNAISLEEIVEMKKPDEIASILQQELPVRLANRIAHLDTLPHLTGIQELQEVRSAFVQSFSEIQDAFASASSDHSMLAQRMRSMRHRHQDQALKITLGMRAWKEIRANRGESPEVTRAFVDQFLDRFFLSWIGMDTLSSQFLALSESSPGGVVDPDCDPYEVASKAAGAVQELAAWRFACPPKIEVVSHALPEARTLPLIPTYLYYILIELLKNSVRAVGEHHEAHGDPTEDPEPVVLRVASDKAQVALQISDRGGGIPFDRQPKVWSYMYSTARTVGPDGQSQPTPLAGFGVGLPLSRLYANYIGGSLHVMSMPNYGTTGYLYLTRAGDRQEALPTYVNWLRKKNLQERVASLEKQKRDAAHMEDYFEAARLKALEMEARAELSTLERDGVHIHHIGSIDLPQAGPP